MGGAKKTTRITKERLLNAVPGSAGLIGIIAKKAKCSRESVRLKVQEFPELAEAIKIECDTAVDEVENQLFRRAKSGSFNHIRLFLQAKAKDRGYVERKEHSGEITVRITAEEANF